MKKLKVADIGMKKRFKLLYLYIKHCNVNE